MLKNKKLPVSIVIPTLGKKNISSCLKYINLGSHLPKEIVIVVPVENFRKVRTQSLLFKKLNIKIIRSNKKNQVSQRILGFKNTKSKYILQLDDDVRLDEKCLLKLYKFILGKSNIAVAPRYSNKASLSSVYHYPNSSLLKIYHWLLNSKKGYSPGTVALCGYNYSDEKSYSGFKFHEWLSGGVVMHDKKNVILKNYYPFNFKRSICEDVLHSFLLRKKNINLIKLFSAKVNADESSRINNELSFIMVIKNLFNEFLIRRYIVRKFCLSIFRLYIYYLIYLARILLKFLKK